MSTRHRNTTGIRRPFTLVELLVIVSILAILSSLLLPALGEAMKAACDITCRNNQRMLISGWSMYERDTNGIMPHMYGCGGTSNVLDSFKVAFPYFENSLTLDASDIRWCPTYDSVYSGSGDKANTRFGYYFTDPGYSINCRWASNYAAWYYCGGATSTHYTDPHQNWFSIPNPASYPFLADTVIFRDPTLWNCYPTMPLGNPGGGWAQVNAAPDYQNVGAVHSNRTTANIAYSDGHVGQIRPMYDIPAAAAAAGVNDAFFLAVLP